VGAALREIKRLFGTNQVKIIQYKKCFDRTVFRVFEYFGKLFKAAERFRESQFA